MSCEDFQNDLLLHADGELRGQASLDFLAHLQRCPDCARQVIAHQQLRAAIARVMGDCRAPAALQASILSVLDADARRRPAALSSGGRHTFKLHWPAAIAAMIALAFVAGWHYRPWAARQVTAADLQPVRVTDEGVVAVELARNIHKLHIQCATKGPAHHDPNLSSNPQRAAEQMGASLGISVLSGDQLRLDVGKARFESAHVCPLCDAANAIHPAAHLVYRNRTDEPISLFSMPAFSDLTDLKTRVIDGRSYAILAPGISTKCHPFTIVVWSGGQAGYLVCAPFADEETMEYVKPIRLALERDPSLAPRLLAMLGR